MAVTKSTSEAINMIVEFYFDSSKELSEQLALIDGQVKRSLASIERNTFLICACLHCIKSIIDKNGDIAGCNSVYEYAAKNYDLGKTSVKNCLAVYNTFFDDSGQINYIFAKYSFSQLVEMLPCKEFFEDLTVYPHYFPEDLSTRQMRRVRIAMQKAIQSGENVSEFEKYLANDEIEETELLQAPVIELPRSYVDNPYAFAQRASQELKYGKNLVTGKKLSAEERGYRNGILDARRLAGESYKKLQSKMTQKHPKSTPQAFSSREYSNQDLEQIFADNDLFEIEKE